MLKIREENKRDGTHASSFLARSLSSLPLSNRFITLFLYLFPLSTDGADAMTWRLQASIFSKSGPPPDLNEYNDESASPWTYNKQRQTKPRIRTLKLRLRAVPPRPQMRHRRDL